MNRKGQVMVAFVLLLPFLLTLFIFVVDIGFMYVEKRNVENNMKQVITYGLKQDVLDESITPTLERLLRKNIDQIKTMDLMVTNNGIHVHVIVQKKTAFSVVLKKYRYEIDVTYQGYIENDKIRIIKE